ncbi:MAG: prolyl aminopeptidase, partial [Saprospiraceae bacterium]|nr:prolyl aminopeptidase [Saprospiraceae bacterium]
GYIQKNITKIADIPAIFIHGRFDMVCQLYNINVLVDAWQNSQLQILPGAGHSGFESQTIDAFCKATDIMAQFLKERESNK